MNRNTLRRVAAVTAATGATIVATPGVAFAAGADILIPKPAEFIPALIAFIVIWIILAKLAWPIIIKVLDAREEKIANDLSAAEESRKSAEQSAVDARDQISATKREAQDIIAAAKREAEGERSKIIAEAQASAVATIAKAKDAVEAERKKAMVELSAQVVDLSVEIASKIIGDALSTEEQHKLAEKYLMEVGDLNED